MHFSEVIFIAKGRSAPTLNLGPPLISEVVRARKLKFYTRVDRASALFGYENFSARGVRGAQRPQCKFGTLHISETIRARKLKFYTDIDRVKYSFQA